MSNAPAVEHFVDGRNAWKIGYAGLFVRIRGLVITGLITLGTMGAPWWWPNEFPAAINTSLLFAVVVFLFGAGIIGFLFFLRNYSIRSLERKYALHQLTHNIRDNQTALHARLLQAKAYTHRKREKDITELLEKICENTEGYFKFLVNDGSIGVAIRLASMNRKKEVVYKTFARSANLNAHRKKSSEPIPTNVGIPKFLRQDKNSQGILIYHDLIEAQKNGTYFSTKNDDTYPDDIVTMMVAPLNAWSGKQQDMIGIMYITSRGNNVFSGKYVDSLAFISDLTVNIISNVFELVDARQKELNMSKRVINV